MRQVTGRSISIAMVFAIAALIAVSVGDARAAAVADARIEVFKAKRELLVYSGQTLRSTYRIALGSNPTKPKRRQGDRATPEGRYYISHKNPRSQFYLSLGVSYPNADDAERGLREKLITKAQRDSIVRAIRAHQPPPSNTALGGDIFVHGNGSATDWTWGCIALDDTDMKALFDSIEVGTPITIHP